MLRPWSTVLRVPTSAGDHYFKATSPLLAHEPALTQWLAQQRPDCIAPVLAVDRDRGWMLMPDGGTTLRTVIQADRDIRHWEAALPIYAQLQIDMAAQLDQLIALGCLDYRLAGLPARYAALLEDTQALMIDLPDGLTGEQYARLRALAPQFADMCARLAAYGIPETLHHDDFHDGNIFLGAGGLRFFDWGESCAAQPFYTLVVGLRGIAYRFELAEDAPELRAAARYLSGAVDTLHQPREAAGGLRAGQTDRQLLPRPDLASRGGESGVAVARRAAGCCAGLAPGVSGCADEYGILGGRTPDISKLSIAYVLESALPSQISTLAR